MIKKVCIGYKRDDYYYQDVIFFGNNDIFNNRFNNITVS